MLGEEIGCVGWLTRPRKPRVFANRRASAFVDLSWNLCGTGLREQVHIKAVFALLPGGLQLKGLSTSTQCL